MDDAAIGRRIGALSPPNLDEARERAKFAAQVQLASGGAASPGLRPTARRKRLATALVTLCAALTAASLLTPPGHAVTSWVGDRLGFGHPGEHPTLRQLREAWTTDTDAEGQPAYVLARGPAPRRDHYEFITYRSRNSGAHCFEIDFPRHRNSYGGGCDEPDSRRPPTRDGIVIDAAGGNSDVDQKLGFVSGRVSENVDSVHVTFDGRSATAQLRTVPQELLDRLGFAQSFKVYMAFLHHADRGGRVRVTAHRRGVGAVDDAELVFPDLRIRLPADVERG